MAKSQKMSNVVNAPAFSAYANVATAIPNSIETKVLFQVEEFDTNGNFASSRFTPTVAGYYQINAQVGFDGSVTTAAIAIKKNTTVQSTGVYIPGTLASPLISASALISMNGTTDYVEVVAQHATGSSVNTVASTSSVTRFDGVLVRPA